MKSIRMRLFVVYVISLSVLVGVFIVLNSFFLKSFYMRQLEGSFQRHYDVIENMEMEDVKAYLAELVRKEGIQSVIYSEENEVVFDSMFAGRPMNRMIPKFRERLAENAGLRVKVIAHGDDKGDAVLVKRIGNGYYVAMYKSASVIQENAKVANTFVIYIGIVLLIVGSIFSLYFSKKLTEPIVKLNEITKKMARQDFSEKFDVKSEDEIGELGANVNLMSDELSMAMESLKDDLQKKEALNQMREEFIANVSHELKTPIGVIRGYVEGMKFNVAQTEKEKARYYDVIISESEKMDKMVRELLALSTIESEATVLDESLFNLSVLIDELKAKYAPIMVDQGVVFEVDVVDDHFVKGDYGKLEQVISNYINNGLHHINGEKLLRVDAVSVGENVRVSVFNTGENIPESEAENIWTSFYKVDKARTRAYGGSGLGLSIVRAIVEKHGGSYGFENEADGVRFYFEMKEIES